MNITLTPEQEKLVTERIQSGRYLNAEHFTAEAFRLLTAREQHEEELSALRSDIDAGWEDAEAGRLLDGPKAMTLLVRRARERTGLDG